MINYTIFNTSEKKRLLSLVVQVFLIIPEHRCALPVSVRVVAQSIAFCVLLCRQYVSLRSKFRVVMSVKISTWKRCSVRICLQLFVGGSMSCSRCLCLFAYSDINTYCLFCFVFIVLCCQFLWIVLFSLARVGFL